MAVTEHAQHDFFRLLDMFDLVFAVVAVVELRVDCDGGMCHCVQEWVLYKFDLVEEIEESVDAFATILGGEW